MLQHIAQGSLFSDESQKRASEGYSPRRTNSTQAELFDQWVARHKSSNDFSTARELSGLTDSELQQLEDEFHRRPAFVREDKLRFAMLTGIALLLVAAACVAVHTLTGPHAQATNAQVLAVLFFIVGFAVFTYGLGSAYTYSAVEFSHRRVGLLTAKLDEGHPWLFDALLMCDTKNAESYRQHTLTHRGRLRGVDYLMLKNLSSVYVAYVQAQPAHEIFDRLQKPELGLRSIHPPE